MVDNIDTEVLRGSLREKGDVYHHPKKRDLETPSLAAPQVLAAIAKICNSRTTKRVSGSTAELGDIPWINRIEGIMCIDNTEISGFNVERTFYLHDKAVWFLTFENTKGQKTRVLGIMIDPHIHSDSKYTGNLIVARCINSDTREIGVYPYHTNNKKETVDAITDFIWKDEDELITGAPGEVDEMKRGIYNAFSELLPPSMPIDIQPPVS
jgi:hypothetical protein